MKIDRPIFILAPARSGTTIFYNLFTRHKETAFPEHFADKYWKTPWKFKIIPPMVKLQIWRYKKRPLPHEGGFWRKYHPYSKYLTETDVIPLHLMQVGLLTEFMTSCYKSDSLMSYFLTLFTLY